MFSQNDSFLTLEVPTGGLRDPQPAMFMNISVNTSATA